VTGDGFHRVVWRELNPRVVESTTVDVSVELCEVFDEALDDRVFVAANHAIGAVAVRGHPHTDAFVRTATATYLDPPA